MFIPIQNVIRPTTWVDSPRLKRGLGLDVTLASETLQYTGSFKFRAAYNLASNVRERHIIAASSGNFGQALALACRLLSKTCVIVMPDTSAQVKIDAVREYGAEVDLIDTKVIGREERVGELARESPGSYIASAYNDEFVIAGNATLGIEIATQENPPDVVIAPVGGGGLTSGLIRGIAEVGAQIEVVAAEPLMANDAARSMREGYLVQNLLEPQTLADGARTVSLGTRNWEILRTGLSRIVEVPEEAIREAVRLLFTHANLKAEPTGALPIGALLTDPESFRDRRICCVISGGNVDPAVYTQILAG